MEITLKINLPDRAVDFKCLDDILTEELNKSGQAAVQEWVDRIEERQFRHREKGLRKERREARYLRFSLFDVRVKRYKVSRPDSSGRRRYSHLVDELLGIGDGVSPSLKRKAIESVCDVSYARASSKVSGGRFGSISRMGLHHWVQKEGKHLRDKREALVRRAFDSGDVPEPKERRKAVAIEADATMIPWGEGKGRHFEVKVGLAYSRKEDKGKNGKRRRMELTDKVVVGSVGSVDEFGQQLFYEAQRNFGVMDSEVFYQSDGKSGFKELQKLHFPGAHAQVDLWHVMRKVCEACSGDRRKVKRLSKLLYRKQIDKFLYCVRMYWVGAKDSKKAERWSDLRKYVEENRGSILHFREFYNQLDEEYRKLLVTGTGAVEKNIDIVVSHRFKKRGMKWSKPGAANLLALRTLRMRPEEWERWWSQAED